MRPEPAADRPSPSPAYQALESLVVGTTGHARLAARNGLLRDKLERRLRTTGIQSLESYLDFLSQAPDGAREFDSLIAELTIGETSFFRHPEQFDVLRDVVLPDLFARRASSRRLRIWSAGCANGAEAYSISILIHALLGERMADWNITIVGSDISRGALEEARAGLFSDWSLRELSDGRRRGFFTHTSEGWAIREKYQQNLHFTQHNLISDEFPSMDKNVFAFDLIFCRNVMIYFDEQTNARLADGLDSVMVDGAWLFVAPADFSPRLQRIFLPQRQRGGAIIYRKPPAARREPQRAPAPFAVPIARDDGAPAAATRKRLTIKPEPPADIPAIVAAANRGEWDRAAALADALLRHDPCNAGARYYRSLILLNTGRARDAERELRRTVYLDRDFALAHYQLGLARRDARDLRAAARAFRNAIEALGDVPDDGRVHHSDDLSAGELRTLATHQLARLGAAK